jgi:twitching motility protein PilT
VSFQVETALRYVVESEGSDLHLKVGAPPMIRIHGSLQPIPDNETLRPEDTEEALLALAGGTPAEAEFEAEGEADFA